MPSIFHLPSPGLHNRLQLPGIPQRILNHHQTHILLRLLALVHARSGEEDLTVLDSPAALVGEVNHRAFALQEEEGFGRRDGQARVRLLAGCGDLGADLGGEDL